MPKKKKDSANSAPIEKTALEQKIENLMGPPPNESGPTVKSTTSKAKSTPAVSPTTAKPSTAPLPPPELVPKETAPVEPVPPTPPPAAEVDHDTTADKAVDDITRQEGDEVLAAEDAALSQAFTPPPAVPPKKHPIKEFFGKWWRNRWARWLTIIFVGAVLAAAAIVPKSRYTMMNLVGLRSSASLTVLDASTGLPLKNVTVSLAGHTGRTGNEGKVQLGHLRLGTTTLRVERRGFATTKRSLTLGWGSNPLGELRLTASGSQYTFLVSDFLSNKPLQKAEANSGEATAVADKNGKIVLTIGSDQAANTLKVSLKADQYRTENIDLSADTKLDQTIKMAPARRHVYVSKRSGKYDLYAVYADGKYETKLLSGTGHERDDIVLSPHPSSDNVAYVSTRDNARNSDGYELSSLLIIDSQSGQSSNLGQSERFKLINWVGDRLVYVQTVAGASTSNPKRQRLISYDIKTEDKLELASSNYFNDVVTMGDQIYFAPSSAYLPSGVNTYRIGADGNNRQIVLNKEVWSLTRLNYDHLSLSAGPDWYEYVAGSLQAAKVSGPPANQNNRIYHDSPNKLFSLWVDKRDGKGVLLRYNLTGDKKDQVLHSQSGLAEPVWWLASNYAVFRVETPAETADYALNLDGNVSRKLSDITKTAGLDNYQSNF